MSNKLKDTFGKKKLKPEDLRSLELLEENKNYKAGFKFFYKNSAHIEILRGKFIERIDFILLPFTHDL